MGLVSDALRGRPFRRRVVMPSQVQPITRNTIIDTNERGCMQPMSEADSYESRTNDVREEGARPLSKLRIASPATKAPTDPLLHALDHVPFTPSQGVRTPSPRSPVRCSRDLARACAACADASCGCFSTRSRCGIDPRSTAAASATHFCWCTYVWAWVRWSRTRENYTAGASHGLRIRHILTPLAARHHQHDTIAT